MRIAAIPAPSRPWLACCASLLGVARRHVDRVWAHGAHWLLAAGLDEGVQITTRRRPNLPSLKLRTLRSSAGQRTWSRSHRGGRQHPRHRAARSLRPATPQQTVPSGAGGHRSGTVADRGTARLPSGPAHVSGPAARQPDRPGRPDRCGPGPRAVIWYGHTFAATTGVLWPPARQLALATRRFPFVASGQGSHQ